MQRAVGALGDDIENEAQIALHGVRRAQTIQRIDHEIGVAQPAEAVVPVARRSGGLGNRRRHRRDDGAGVLEDVQLERDRGADDGVLPLERNRERAHPSAPVRGRLGQKPLPRFVRRILKRFIGPEHQRHSVVEEECILFQNRSDGNVARETQDNRGADVTNVIAAVGCSAQRLAVVLRRSGPHANARVSRQASHAPDQHHGTKHPAVMLEARCEVDDLDFAARGIPHARHENGRVLDVALLGLHAIDDFHREEADVLARSGPRLEQRAEHGIAIEARETRPVDLAHAVDEGADRAVADERQIERAHEAQAPASHSRTARTFGSRQRAAVRPGPTPTA